MRLSIVPLSRQVGEYEPGTLVEGVPLAGWTRCYVRDLKGGPWVLASQHDLGLPMIPDEINEVYRTYQIVYEVFRASMELTRAYAALEVEYEDGLGKPKYAVNIYAPGRVQPIHTTEPAKHDDFIYEQKQHVNGMLDDMSRRVMR